MGVYHFVSRTKTRDKIATMYNILIIYSSKKDTLESVETKNMCSMVNGVEGGRQVKQGQSCNFTLVHTDIDINMYFHVHFTLSYIFHKHFCSENLFL